MKNSWLASSVSQGRGQLWRGETAIGPILASGPAWLSRLKPSGPISWVPHYLSFSQLNFPSCQQSSQQNVFHHCWLFLLPLSELFPLVNSFLAWGGSLTRVPVGTVWAEGVGEGGRSGGEDLASSRFLPDDSRAARCSFIRIL